MTNILYYHKCNDCLTPFSSTERHIDLCDCDGAVTFMGQVQGDKYILTANKPACDGRCTHASGPHCDCACNGVNHGSGRVVQTIIKEGKVKAIDFSEEDMLRAYKYRELKNYAEGMYTLFFSKGTDPWASNKMRRELDHALGLRVYDKRHNELLKFIIKHKSTIS